MCLCVRERSSRARRRRIRRRTKGKRRRGRHGDRRWRQAAGEKQGQRWRGSPGERGGKRGRLRWKRGGDGIPVSLYHISFIAVPLSLHHECVCSMNTQHPWLRSVCLLRHTFVKDPSLHYGLLSRPLCFVDPISFRVSVCFSIGFLHSPQCPLTAHAHTPLEAAENKAKASKSTERC